MLDREGEKTRGGYRPSQGYEDQTDPLLGTETDYLSPGADDRGQHHNRQNAVFQIDDRDRGKSAGEGTTKQGVRAPEHGAEDHQKNAVFSPIITRREWQILAQMGFGPVAESVGWCSFRVTAAS